MTDLSHLKEPWQRLHWARLNWQRTNSLPTTMVAAARALGMDQNTYSAYEREPGKSKHIEMDHERAVQFARKFKCNWVWLLTGADTPFANLESEFAVTPQAGAVRMVPLVGEVRAGAFLSITESFEPRETFAYYDPQYDRADLFALRVAGNSMNLEYPDGSIVVCAPAVQSGVFEGDHVILQIRDTLGRAETTLKEVRMNGDQVEFWPRSNDPAHQTPFTPPPQTEHTDVDWEVTGIVISTITKRPPRRGRMINFAPEYL